MCTIPTPWLANSKEGMVPQKLFALCHMFLGCTLCHTYSWRKRWNWCSLLMTCGQSLQWHYICTTFMGQLVSCSCLAMFGTLSGLQSSLLYMFRLLAWRNEHCEDCSFFHKLIIWANDLTLAVFLFLSYHTSKAHFEYYKSLYCYDEEDLWCVVLMPWLVTKML